MTTYLGKSCSFGLPRVPFVNCCQFMYLVISLLVLRAGCGIWLYQFLIIAYLFTSHFVASWYRQPGSTSEEFHLFREQLDYIRTRHKGKKLPSVHVLGDFNFKDIDWPDRLSKSGSTLSQSEGQILIDIMNDHGLKQMVHFPTREKNTLDLILTTLPGQFQDIHSPDKLSDHDIVSGTLKIFVPPIKKPRRKMYLYQKGDYESMRKDFAKEKYFNGHSDTRSLQENFDLLTSFIQDSADKHIPSKTSRSVSSIPWITPEIRRKIRRKNKTHAKAKKTGSSKVRSKFETLRREIKTPQGSPGVGHNTFLSSPHLCFIIVFICDLFVSRDDPLMS